VAAEVHTLTDPSSKPRPLAFIIPFTLLCAALTGILVFGSGWLLAVPGLVILGLVAVTFWLKRLGKGPFKTSPGG